MKNWQLVIVAGFLALLSGFGGYQLQLHLKAEDIPQTEIVKKELSPEAVIGMEADDFVLSDVDGAKRNLSEWQGKVVALNFWATWCPPCRDEIPYFVELQEQYSSDGLQFIGIALQEAHEIRDFLEEFNVNYPSLVGSDDVIEVSKALGNDIGALPYTVMLDRNGTVVFTKRGPITKDEAESVIQTLL